MFGFPEPAERERRSEICKKCVERIVKTLNLGVAKTTYDACGICGCAIIARVNLNCPGDKW